MAHPRESPEDFPAATTRSEVKPMRITPFISLVAFLAACSSNPVCETEVLNRLVNDCRLTVSVVSIAACQGLSGSPEVSGIQSEAERFNLEACRIEDPDLDAECLKTEQCMPIEQGACNLPDRTVRETDCVSTCFRSESECSEGCRMRATFDECSNCKLSCAETHRTCVDACPTKTSTT
jgi:hypothetical protein